MADSFVVPDELLARCVGRVELAKRVVGTFVGQLNEDVPQLATEIRNGKSEDATRLAHRIKGASANVAAERLREDAATLEQLARDRQMGAAKAKMEALEADWQHYVEITTTFLAS